MRIFYVSVIFIFLIIDVTNSATVSFTVTIQNSDSFEGPTNYGAGVVCLEYWS